MSDAEAEDQPRPRRRKLELLIVFVILLGSILTLAMGGFVQQPETIQMVSGLDHVSSVYGELSSRATIGYHENFAGWSIGHKAASAEARIRATPTSLAIEGSFQNASQPASVGVFKSVIVNITSIPILEARLNVTRGIGYGLRFFSEFPNGTKFNVWWEGSSLDHRPGKGYELIRVNMQLQAFRATGRILDTLTQFELYVEARANTSLDFRLELLGFKFLSEEIGQMGSPEGYRAVYIDLRTKPDAPPSWYLNKVQVGASILASPGTTFALHLFDGYKLYTTVDSPNSFSYNSLTPAYNFAFYPKESRSIFPELLPKSQVSVVLTADSGSFKEVTLNYLDFIFLPRPEQAADLSPQAQGLYYTYFVFFLFLLPLGLAILVYREFFGHQKASRRVLGIVLMVGLFCRLALAPLTAHEFDMNIFLTSARAWFEYGTPRGSLGPTLPLTFFLYWIPYSFYALIQSLGFHDVFLPSHAAGIVEAIFIKLFPIIADSFLFMMLLRFKSGGKPFVWASFFFLNPLTIFDSSVRGHYDSATLALVILGVYWLKDQRIMRAGSAFVASGMLELLGLVPYVFLILKLCWTRQYKLALGVVSMASLLLVYPPQRDLLYRLTLSISGIISNPQFSPLGHYALLGTFDSLAFISNFHPLLIVGGLILFGISLDGFKQRLHPDSILLYTGLSYVAFVLLLGRPNSWFWVLPVGILYSILKGKDSLGAYMLVFGAALSFLTVALTTGSAYYLLGKDHDLLQPWIEGVQNQVEIFVIMGTILTALFLAHMMSSRNDRRPMLLSSSLLVLGLFLLVYFWVGINPV